MTFTQLSNIVASCAGWRDPWVRRHKKSRKSKHRSFNFQRECGEKVPSMTNFSSKHHCQKGYIHSIRSYERRGRSKAYFLCKHAERYSQRVMKRNENSKSALRELSVAMLCCVLAMFASFAWKMFPRYSQQIVEICMTWFRARSRVYIRIRMAPSNVNMFPM